MHRFQKAANSQEKAKYDRGENDRDCSMNI